MINIDVANPLLFTIMREEWKSYKEDGLRSEFLISNLGRVKSIPRNNPDKPVLLSGYKNMGYHAIPTRKLDGKNTLRYVHKLVAQLFVPKPEGSEYLIFKDYKRENCQASNLKWATKQEYSEYKKHFARSGYYYNPDFKPNAKLTPAKVKLIRKMVNDPNRKTRYKMIANQFGISQHTLFSIKRGDSWKEI